MFAFIFNDALMKLSLEKIPIFQAIFVRGLICSVFIALVVLFTQNIFVKISKQNWTIIFVRSTCEAVATITFLTALQHMPLANALSILQSVPLAVVMVGALFLRERVGWRRWTAILIGFCGVLIIIDPSGSDFTTYTFLVLVTVIAATARDVLTRRLSDDVPSLLVVIFTAIPTCILGGIGTISSGWVTIQFNSYVIFLGAGVLILFGYLFSVMAMRSGDISFVAPFRFSAMIWAIGFGVLFFGDLPNFQTLFGTALVISMGLYSFRREYLNQSNADLSRTQ
jgi:drug/metabolite transporter (DMT)-like permease